MFTGLVEETGKVVSLQRSSRGALLRIRTGLTELGDGESIAVNGVCQTVTGFSGGVFSCDLLPETLRVTNLGALRPDSEVNLERALRPGDRMGGHIVNGHIDGAGRIKRVSTDPSEIVISADAEIMEYIVPKGSVALDGISLTIGPEVSRNEFSVYIIPHTLARTNLRKAVAGTSVNIEVDIIAKYIYKFTQR